MRPRLLAALAALLAGPMVARAAHAQADAGKCPVFVVEHTRGGLQIQRELLSEGEVVVFTRDLDSGTVEVILPVGPGRSAAFLNASDRDRIVVRFAGGELRAQVRRAAGGEPVVLPARKLADLREQDIRVSVTLRDRTRAAFTVVGWDTAMAEPIGPAANMFAGRLPAALAQQGAVVETETWRSAPAVPACGRAALERDRWLFARAALPGGREGWFVVDLAASETVVARSVLAAAAAIEPLSTLEHSAGGTRRLPYAPGGATGSVQNVLGSTTLASLTFGTIRYEQVHATVLDSLPAVFGRPVAGILGMDLLRGCARLRLEFAAEGRAATLLLTQDAPARRPAHQAPFAWVSSHLMLRGAIAGKPARWILDSGAPGTVLDAADAPELPRRAAGTLGGLDGAKQASEAAMAPRLSAGEREWRDVSCRIAALSVFEPLREPGIALGVLGLAELSRTRALEVDFEARVVRWYD